MCLLSKMFLWALHHLILKMKKPFAPAEKSNVLQLTRMEQISIPNIDSPNVQFSNGLYTTSRLKENYIYF